MMTNSSLRPALLVFSLAIALAGCDNTLRQDMANQPRQNTLSPASVFADGRSERQLLDNTVPRGSVEDDSLFVPKDSNAFPLPITQQLLERGQER